MNFACIAVLGTLCYVNAPGNGVDQFLVQYHKMGETGVTVSTDNWRVEEELSSDCSGCKPPLSLYSKACIGADCIAYHRRCDDVDRPTMCEYFFDKYPPIDVLAKTADDFQDAVSTVAMLISDDPKQPRFPLSIFSKEGPPGPYANGPLVNDMRQPPSQGVSK